ncbi:MAG: hypothetical protein JXQ67_07280 [Campylobacterales bacterium]|nr:hypothetical protein [Campylobacterales bacterium]
MAQTIEMSFAVTDSQNETIMQRALENGFDDITVYLKVVALKAQPFALTSAGLSDEEITIKLAFTVSEAQKAQIESNAKESNCEDINTYLKYVALHSVVNAAVEVRSTGTLDAMLERIAKSRNMEKPRRLF